jgi:apolipoprotein D and lipocalin family protein
MGRRYLCFWAVLAAWLAAACAQAPVNRTGEAPPSVVSLVNLQRYAGLWYEIARYPNSFEEDCVGVTAQYQPNGDGTVSVVNTCRKFTLDGEIERAQGTARIVEGSNNAKLKVQFAPDWVPFAAGDYWILDLPQDYSHALVGSPDGRYLWILAREPQLPDEKLAQIFARASALGYDVSALEMVAQPPETLPQPLE